MNLNKAWLEFESKPLDERIKLANEWEAYELKRLGDTGPQSKWMYRRTAQYLREGYAGGLHRNAPVGVRTGCDRFIRWFRWTLEDNR